MTMTVDEIVMEYKQAKDPDKQIRIIADQCLCRPSEIRTILKEAGVYQPKTRTPKAEPKVEAQPSAPAETTTQPRDQAKPEKGFSFTVSAPDLPPGDFEKLKEWAKEPRHDLPASNVQPEPLYDIGDIKASALDAIADMFPYDADEGEVFNFTERVRGVLTFVQQLEGWPRP